MRQLFLQKGAVLVKEVCQPLLDDCSVLVSVHYSFISSGTELATISNAQKSLLNKSDEKIKKVFESIALNGIDGTRALIKGKLQGELQALGYSCSGSVIAVGKKVTKFKSGDLVACAGAGYAHHADLVCVPENLVALVSKPDALKKASLTTIGAIALQGIRRAEPKLGETVCVIGLGLLGQITVQLAKQSGCTVIGVDLLEERCTLAKKLGAAATFKSSSETGKEIEFFTKHNGADVTIITAASASDAIIQQAMHMTRKKGKVVLVGDVGLNLERNPLYQKEIDFLISCSYGPGRYDHTYEKLGHDYPYAYVRWTENRNMQTVVDLIESGALDVTTLISDEIPIELAAQAFERLTAKQGLGIVITYDGASNIKPITEKKPAKKTDEIKFIPAVKDTIRVGIVGAGGFAKVKLMPIVARINNVKINAIVDPDIATSINASRLYGAARALNNDTELFEQDLVDAVIISSPHKFHCEQALHALQNGKAVFLEKPMVTTFKQLDQLYTFLKTNSSLPFCVDYNRSFSPFIQKIKSVVKQRSSPMVIHYRMNAGFISKDHWLQSDVGAGRLIGEACHIFELFCFLTDAQPVAVSVETLRATDENLFPTDNFSAQISFSDGSICTLLYTSIGHARLGKERMELFYDSKSIVMNDYLELQGFGLTPWFDEIVTTQDKGHEALLKAFFESVKHRTVKPPMTHEYLHKVAQLTLIIDQLACQGGGTQELTI